MGTERPSTRSPQIQRAMDLLADGEWRDREEVLAEMGKAITPAIALRFQEQIRLAKRKTRVSRGLPVMRETDERLHERTDFTKITMGRRALAMKSLQSAKRFETVKQDDGRYRTRLLPAKPYKRRTSESNRVGLSPEPR